MKKKDLTDVLICARESGIDKPAVNTFPGKYYEAWKISVNEEIHRKLLKVIRSCADLDYLNRKMFVLGNGGSWRVDHDVLIKHLLYRTTEVGEEQAVEELERYNKLNYTPAFEFLALSSIEVEKKVKLTKNISLVPFDSIPESFVKSILQCSALKSKEISFLTPYIESIASFHPKAALQKKVTIKPKSFDPETEDKSFLVWSNEDLYQICDCFSLVSLSAPIVLANWVAPEEWVPFSTLLGGGWNSPANDVLNKTIYKFSENDYHDILKYVREFFSLERKLQEVLRVPLRRLNQFRRKWNEVDRAIDLGIALESLLLHDHNENDPISFPFRLRGSWMLAGNSAEREEYLKLFKEIYDCRCAAVHAGKFSNRFKKKLSLPINKLMDKGDSLCIEIIKKILQTKEFPVWNKLILGIGGSTE